MQLFQQLTAKFCWIISRYDLKGTNFSNYPKAQALATTVTKLYGRFTTFEITVAKQ